MKTDGMFSTINTSMTLGFN